LSWPCRIPTLMLMKVELPLSTRPTSVCEARRTRYGTPLRARGQAKGAHRDCKTLLCIVGRGWRLALADGAVDSVRVLETMPRERAIPRILDTLTKRRHASCRDSHALACSRMLSHALACAMEPNDARRRASCQNGALHLLESPSQRRRWRGAPPAPAWHTTWTPSQTLATAAQRSACTSRCGAIGYATVHSAPSVLSGAATLDEAGSGLVILLLGHP